MSKPVKTNACSIAAFCKVYYDTSLNYSDCRYYESQSSIGGDICEHLSKEEYCTCYPAASAAWEKKRSEMTQ